ncbi:MAG: type II toxin-antitoxin system prevent-host-death family antitoxin [Myxococcota bacterium]|nr:type II toxin-antitoxin system prevent-host-death family antitoxin [Myxococcota bacterium]
MTSVNVTEFRKHLQIYLAMASSGEEVEVTRRGVLVARLTPPSDSRDRAKRSLRELRKKMKLGDVESPIEVSWEADSASS